MIAHIVRHDWWLVRSSPLNRILLALLALFLGVAAWKGASLNRERSETFRQIAFHDSARYAKLESDIRSVEANGFKGSPFQDPSSPFTVSGRYGGRFICYPLKPLSGWVIGQSDLFPNYQRVTATKKAGLILNEEIENPQILFNGSFDMAFVVVYLLPLLIIAFTYNLVASEREWGTLKLLLSESVSMRRILQVRMAFRFLLFAVALSLLLLVCATFGGIPIDRGFLSTLSLILAWSALWFGLSFFLNATVNRNSGDTVAALVATWLLFVLLFPGVLNLAVGRFYPIPSRISLITETREAAEDVKKRSSQALARYLDDHPELARDSSAIDADDFATRFYTSQIEIERTLAPLEAAFAERLQKQNEWVRRFQWLSPALVVQDRLGAVAQTDEASFRAFSGKVDSYYKTLQEYHTARILRKQKHTSASLATIPLPPEPGLPESNGGDAVAYLMALSALLTIAGWLRLSNMGLHALNSVGSH
jgi:ABC-2 type transport system permease protein